MDSVKIQVQFTKVTDDGISFTDALYFDVDEFENISDAQLEAMKQTRFDNWKKAISTPSPSLPTEEQIANIDEQIEQLTNQRAALQEEA